MRRILPIALAATCACGGSTPPPKTEPPPKPAAAPPPSGPTRTDWKTIAGKLVQRCIAGGWIAKWRSTAPDIDQAKPKIHLRDFEDKTGQSLDPTYLGTELEKKMRTSGVFEMMSSVEGADFIGRGRLLRLAERSASGERTSVYTATLEMLDPKTEKVAYSCEASVTGEM